MRYHLKTTPEGWTSIVRQIGRNLSNVTPMVKKFGKRWQTALRRNLRQGKNANGKPMDPLSSATLNSLVTAEDGWTIIGVRKNLKGGSTPLNATGKMVSKFIYTMVGRNGFVMYVNDEHRRMVSSVNVKTRHWRAKNPKAAQKALAHKGIHTSIKGVSKGWRIPGRVPFALNSRQIKRSVTELNKFVLAPLFRSAR